MPSDSPTNVRGSGEGDALILVDLQEDFIGGSLAVPRAASIIDGVNFLSGAYPFALQVATQDWHPPRHCSFAGGGGAWPAHCVRGTPGAALHPRLSLKHVDCVLRKGLRADCDSYSGFGDAAGRGSGLAGLLRERGVRRVFVCGLALDYCVAATAEGARAAGFETFVLADLALPVSSEKGEERVNAMKKAGIHIIRSEALVGRSSL